MARGVVTRFAPTACPRLPAEFGADFGGRSTLRWARAFAPSKKPLRDRIVLFAPPGRAVSA
jgi:hypothetical protein